MSSWILAGMALLAAQRAAQEPIPSWLPHEAVADTLRAMQEPPLGKLVGSERTFRFLWLRSFHKPILIQVEKNGPQQYLVVKMLDRPWGLGVDGVQIGKLTVARRRPLADAEWHKLADLRLEGFWKQASTEPEAAGVDGADWILEGSSWGERHIVWRWSPESGAFRELCLAMLRLSGVPVTPDELY